MSCSELHDDEDHFHLHGLGGDHEEQAGEAWYNTVAKNSGQEDAGHDDGETADDDGGTAAGGGHEDDAAAFRKPAPVKLWLGGMWKTRGYMARPFLWAAGADGYSMIAHALTAGHPLTGVLAALGAGAVAEVTMETVHRKTKRSESWRSMSRKEILAATVWGMIASGFTPTGWEDIMQWAALGALGLPAANRVRVERKSRKDRRAWPPEPAGEITAAELPREQPAEAAPPPDPRMTRFTARFCGEGGQLEGVTAEEIRDTAEGFLLVLRFESDSHSKDTVEGLAVPIARLYDVTKDAISVSYLPDRPSEARCQVIVRTVPAGSARKDPSWNRWDGQSSYDPETGLIDLGRYADGATAHYLLHTPGSGAAMGMVAGAPGQGKTGTLHVIIGESGLAMMCARCGVRGDCETCDMRRIAAVWAADPQEQGFSVWRERADLTGWGAEGSAELIDLAEAISDARGKVLADTVWYDYGPDGEARENTGKGFFDPVPGFPLIVLVIDELPKLVKHPDQQMAAHALQVLADGIMEWRKRGIHILFGSQMLDITQIGVKELREMAKYINSVSHRTDEVSSWDGGIKGRPQDLPRGEKGVGYINGPDDRSDVWFYTKLAPETLKPGMEGVVDIRHVAGLIARTPVDYHPCDRAVMETWGIRDRDVLKEWRGRPSASADDVGMTAPAAGGDGASADGTGGIAYREDCEKVLAALEENPGAELPELMEITELDLNAVNTAISALIANGQIESDAAA